MENINKEDVNDLPKRPSIWGLIVPFWVSNEKILSFSLIAIILSINLTTTYTFLALNKLNGRLTDALIALNWPVIKLTIFNCLGIGLISTAMPLISVLAINYLALRWRTWMTSTFIHNWINNNAYYKIERDELVTNIDQRISEDINLFTETTINLATNIINVLVNLITFTTLLWSLSGTLRFTLGNYNVSIHGYMVYSVYIYSFLQLALSHWLGKVLIGVNINKQTVEADFRFLSMQLRENSEQIAFFCGDKIEQKRLLERFMKVRSNSILLMRKTFKLNFFQNMFAQVFSPLPTLLAMPLLLSGVIKMGGLTQITMAYGMVLSTLSFFPQAYQSFTNWIAQVNRLRDTIWAINKSLKNKGSILISHKGDDIICSNLMLNRPDGLHLSNIQELSILQGQRWMVSGMSGTGKSTLLRACAGLWPYGKGEITLPKSKRMMFIPQKSYIPSGSLKNALSYPEESDKFSDEQYHQVLVDCLMEQRAESLTQTQRWQHVLSGGEQQRIAIARVLLHQPDIIFLDEATSALDPDTEAHLYQILIDKLPNSTLISVAHRVQLKIYHQYNFTLNPANQK